MKRAGNRMAALLGAAVFAAACFCTGAQGEYAPQTAPADAPEPAGEGLRIVEAPLYQVIGYEYAGVRAVADVCAAVSRALAPAFPPPETLPRPLLVQLMPADDSNRGGVPWVLEEGDRGAWILSIRWDADTRLRDVCEGAACALTAQGVAARHGMAAARALPAWLPRALGLSAYARLSGVRLDGLQEACAQTPALSLSDLLLGNGEPERLANDGFWLLRTLQNAYPERALFGRAVERLALENDRAAALAACFPECGATPAERELWWAVNRRARIEETPPRVWTIAQTREFLAQSALVGARVEGADRLLTLAQLWDFRESPAARAAAVDRLRVLRLRASRLNPVYFNAGVSFGKALEALIAGNERDFRASYAQFERDLQGALALETAIVEELTRPPRASVSSEGALAPLFESAAAETAAPAPAK